MWWSWALSASTIAGFTITARGSRTGWLVCLGSEILWTAYSLATRQLGFLLSVIPFTVVYAWNWIAAGRRSPHRKEEPDGLR